MEDYDLTPCNRDIAEILPQYFIFMSTACAIAVLTDDGNFKLIAFGVKKQMAAMREEADMFSK